MGPCFFNNRSVGLRSLAIPKPEQRPCTTADNVLRARSTRTSRETVAKSLPTGHVIRPELANVVYPE